MPALYRKSIVLLRMQASEGTFVTPLVTDGILVSDLSVAFTDENIFERNVLRADSRLGQRQACAVNRRVQVSFTTEVRGSGGMGVEPEAQNLFRISGFDESVIPGVSVIYTVTPTPNLWGSMTVHQDGNRYNLVDVVADLVTTIDANMQQKDAWVCTGRISSIDINIAVPVVTYDASKPIASNNLNMIYNSVLIYGMNNLVFTLGNELSSNQSLSASEGLVANTIVDNLPTLAWSSLQNNPELIDYNNLWQTNFVGPLTMSVLGATAGNRVLHAFPAVSLSSVTPGVDGKLLNTSIVAQLNETVGSSNDFYQRVYT